MHKTIEESVPRWIARRLRDELAPLRFGAPVTHVYQPLDYAWEGHAAWLDRWATGRREVVLLGMNPGPWGMAQTGVPFGEPASVRPVLGIDVGVGRPVVEHAKRRVVGFASARRDVSGQRVWGWVRDVFGGAEAFFERFVIVNYCPLSFMEASGRNRTPDKLPASERAPLYAACDAALQAVIAHHQPRWVVGIGGFAEGRARAAWGEGQGQEWDGEGWDGSTVQFGRILHPSPANPAANRGWMRQATAELAALGLVDAGLVARAAEVDEAAKVEAAGVKG